MCTGSKTLQNKRFDQPYMNLSEADTKLEPNCDLKTLNDAAMNNV